MNTPHPIPSLAEVVDLVEQAERARRIEDARRLRLLSGALDRVHSEATSASPVIMGDRVISGSREMAYRSLRAELATAMTVSEHMIDRELSLADSLSRYFPATFAELEAASISKQHAKVLVDEGCLVGVGDDPVIVERRAAYEQAVLEAAKVSTSNQLRPIARKLAEVWAEATIEERHREACNYRSVTVVDAGDGMADLLAHLPLVEAIAIKDRLTRIARSAERGERIVRSAEERAELVAECEEGNGDIDDAPVEGEEQSLTAPHQDPAICLRQPQDDGRRTRDQVRADAFTELLLEADVFDLSAGSPAEAIDARIQLIAPAELATPTGTDGDGDLLVELAGHGPIDTGTARELAASASHWEDTKVHPDTGVVLSVDRYRPSTEMRRLLGARDQRCRFPGCRVPVHRCDFDHIIDAAIGGKTSTENLQALCRGHHTLKHHTDWRVEQVGGGVLRWMSPAGRKHETRPPDTRIPRRVPPPPNIGSRRPVTAERHQTAPPGRALPTGKNDTGRAKSTVRFATVHPF